LLELDELLELELFSLEPGPELELLSELEPLAAAVSEDFSAGLSLDVPDFSDFSALSEPEPDPEPPALLSVRESFR
jgi:hypothetical protein